MYTQTHICIHVHTHTKYTHIEFKFETKDILVETMVTAHSSCKASRAVPTAMITEELELKAREVNHVLWFWCALVTICPIISPKCYHPWTWDLNRWMQQRLKFIRLCKSIVTSPSDMELWACEINHFFMILMQIGKFVWLYLLNPSLYRHETCTIG